MEHRLNRATASVGLPLGLVFREDLVQAGSRLLASNIVLAKVVMGLGAGIPVNGPDCNERMKTYVVVTSTGVSWVAHLLAARPVRGADGREEFHVLVPRPVRVSLHRIQS